MMTVTALHSSTSLILSPSSGVGAPSADRLKAKKRDRAVTGLIVRVKDSKTDVNVERRAGSLRHGTEELCYFRKRRN